MGDGSAGETGRSFLAELLDVADRVPDEAEAVLGIRLRFSDPEMEREFREEFKRKNLPQARVSLALAAVLYGLFGVLDPYLHPTVLDFAWFVRYCVVCPLFLLTLAASYSRCCKTCIEQCWVPLGLLAGGGIILMGVGESQRGGTIFHLYYDYAGLMIVSSFAYSFTRIRVLQASIIAWGVVILYDLAAVWTGVPAAALVRTNFFLLSLNVLGLFACYWMERFVRIDFVQQRLIRRQAENLRRALAEVKVLSGLLPICSWCKKVRDDRGYWTQIEEYLRENSEARLTHGICPECEAQLLAEISRPYPPDAPLSSPRRPSRR